MMNVACGVDGMLDARGLVMTAAANARALYEPLAKGYEKRGIWHSEMLALCGVCQHLGIEVIIESGRARGHSTRLMAGFFDPACVRILSIDWERASWYLSTDEDYAQKKLFEYPHVELFQGDSHRMIPALLEKVRGKRVALLVDGPKELEALHLIRMQQGLGTEIVVCFVHDIGKGVRGRREIETRFRHAFFTDDPEYVEKFRDLDTPCYGTWQPYRREGKPQQSYGPTLAVLFPEPREAYSWQERLWAAWRRWPFRS